jgi:hypothetical protein
MSRNGASSPMDADPTLGWRFPVRRIPFSEAGDLLRASIAPFRAAPLRLIGMFLLLWLPIVVLTLVDTVGPLLAEMAAAVAFTGYTAALDAATRSDRPDFRHLGIVLRFDRAKWILLLLSSVLPTLIGYLVLCGVWGIQETSTFLAESSRPGGQPMPVMVLDLRTAEYIANMPFTFVIPVWALYRWSASRSMAANFLACVVNWRWVLAIAGFQALADTLLIRLHGLGDDLLLLSVIGGIALQMLELSFTLALAQRSFPSR